MNSIFLNSCDGAKKHYRYLGSGMNRDKGVVAMRRGRGGPVDWEKKEL